ncbi:BRISC and BRCA1-A complex member 1-like isoform X1 [Saccostrea echinata]|uniref:BRISC and BRCA1-A complex member 1-like isoform X1 n=1 Tax=Saccostrea echinata TaxID=191078 RepID=UPI002A825DA7|nr:BRISC and BRCA1-A complex member 1-like isoform X1 [Saccostrea echinata]
METENESGNEQENYSRLVSSVIHEYDIIDMQSGSKSEGSSNEDAKSRDSCQDDVTLPRVNCPEKIIICLDMSSEMDKVSFRSRSGDKWTPMKLVRRALSFFLHSKQRINKNHQFALVHLFDKASWVKDFTGNIKSIMNALDDLSETVELQSFNATSLFDLIHQCVPLPEVEGDVTILPPPYVVRMLFIYGRSNGLIEFHDKESYRLLDSSPYFVFDALYVHEPPSEENKCEEIFDRLCDFDEKGMSYIFEAARNPTRLYDQMSQLLAHPLQRPLQGEVSYRLHNVADLTDT